MRALSGYLFLSARFTCAIGVRLIGWMCTLAAIVSPLLVIFYDASWLRSQYGLTQRLCFVASEQTKRKKIIAFCGQNILLSKERSNVAAYICLTIERFFWWFHIIRKMCVENRCRAIIEWELDLNRNDKKKLAPEKCRRVKRRSRWFEIGLTTIDFKFTY